MAVRDATIGAVRARRTPLLQWHRVRRGIARLLLYAVLLGGAAVLMVPLIWTISTSLKLRGAVFAYPPQWIPDPIVWSNYLDVFRRVPYARFVYNTAFIAVTATIGQVVSASLVAFGFARLRFPGRDFLFVVLLATLMLPFPVYMIPQFVLFRTFGWLDSPLPLIVPAYFGGSAFYIFLLRQFFMTVPLDMDDAARVDGAGTFRIYLHILVPLSLPAHAIVAIFSFLTQWNDFLGPLLYLNSTEKFTLSLGLYFFRGQSGTEWNLLMAASLMMMLPCLLLFFAAQRYFIQGIVISGLKE
jgi:multiple sugar transport system permease protein